MARQPKRKLKRRVFLMQTPAVVLPSQPPATSNGVVSCTAPPPDELNTDKADLKHLGGGKSDLWNNHLINQTINTAFFPKDITQAAKDQHCCGILGFLAGVNPADVIEGMVAGQLYASHASAMECYRRAYIPDTPLETRETLLALAAKLTKANAAQVEALKKHRGKGQQKVIVEHVHVYQGGQAIVGNVTPGGSGKNMEVQPHAIGHEAGTPMRCADTKRKTLSGAGDA